MQEEGWTRAQCRALDRLVIEEYGIPGIVLMEHAGRSVAEAMLAEESSAKSRGGSTCFVFCGGGNNGGDGFVIARWLDDAGIGVACISTADEASTRGDARLARDACRRAGVTLHDASTRDRLDAVRALLVASPPRIVVDALLGTGFEGRVREDVARAIRCVNELRERGARTWSVDLPSGLDCDSGALADPSVQADVTATFVARKRGFSAPDAQKRLGRVLVLPIGAPRAAVERIRRDGGPNLTPG
jgi:NAD(P)H-hydrate epimerase